MSIAFRIEEALTLLAYGVDLLARPGLRRWDQSYETWLYSNGLLRRVQYLEQARLLQRKESRGEWVHRLTNEGRLRVYGGRDPERYWSRKWDGYWRQIVFDLPANEQPRRVALIRWLRQQGFGYLQDSVWVTPDPIRKFAMAVKEHADDVESIAIFEARCKKPFSDAALVMGAWPTARINENYHEYRSLASSITSQIQGQKLPAPKMVEFLRREREQWLSAFELDPLLPACLCPEGYEGRQAWRERCILLKRLSAKFGT